MGELEVMTAKKKKYQHDYTKYSKMSQRLQSENNALEQR